MDGTEADGKQLEDLRKLMRGQGLLVMVEGKLCVLCTMDIADGCQKKTILRFADHSNIEGACAALQLLRSV